MPSRSALNVSLTPELTAYVGECVVSGQYRSASEVIREALRCLQDSTPDTIEAANHAFLLRFSDRISPLKDPRRIMAEAAFLLGSHLEADRAGYAEMSADGEHFTIRDDWVAGDMPSMAGRYRLKDFGAPLAARLRKGEALTYADAAAEPLTQVSEDVAAAFSAAQHRASIVVPLVKDGRLQAVLFVHQRTPRDWTMADERVAHGVAARTWEAVERARAVTALAESEARFRGMFEAAFQLMGLLSPDGIVLEANQAAISFAGVPPDHIIGRPLWETPWWTKSPDKSAAGRLKAAIAQAAEGHPVHYEVLVTAAGDRVATVDFSIRPIRDSSQIIVCLLPEGRDITDTKRTLEKLAESEARFRALADAMPQMIWASDPQGNNIYSNARFLDFLGLPCGFKALPWQEIVHPEDRALSLELRRQSLITGKPFEREHRLRRYDGVYRWVLARALPVRDAAGKIETWFGTSTDITDIVDARQVIKQSHDDMERLIQDRTRALEDAAHELAAEMRRRDEMQTSLLQAQKLEALGQLTSGVAHDFNNVLTAISGSYELLRRRSDPLVQLKIIEQGEKALDRASRLVSQLMSFARRDNSAPKLLDLASMLPDTADLLCHAIGSGMSCEFDISPLVSSVIADPNELEVALLNLAVNARDAMSAEGRITISARNLDAADVPGELLPQDYVSIAVADTGAGMPPEVISRATETFFTTKPEGKGTGLGLAMVNGFAKRHGGCLRIESTQGEGTTIEIILPRAPIDTTEGGMTLTGPAETGLHGDAKILLVDNDNALRHVLATHLRELGYVVLEAASAEAAGALVRTLKQLDLLITDVVMPGSSGTMLAHSLRTERPDLPVLFMTGGDIGPELAGETVLAKPFSVTAISSAVLTSLGRSSLANGVRDRLMRRLKTPALRRLYLTWLTCMADRNVMPTLSELDPARFGLGPHSYVIDVEGQQPPSFRFRSVGSALTQRLGRALNGGTIDGGFEEEELLGEQHTTYRRCLRSRTPVYQSARFDFGDGVPLSFERLVLPLSEGAETITQLVGIAVFSDAPQAFA